MALCISSLFPCSAPVSFLDEDFIDEEKVLIISEYMSIEDNDEAVKYLLSVYDKITTDVVYYYMVLEDPDEADDVKFFTLSTFVYNKYKQENEKN